ncbi:hypothetical protein C2S51_010438 [Perilla frutescens var. frutescens]|nr:hypothetical protein C2S51_010438 [Perilla frutescens var. frutescens]
MHTLSRIRTLEVLKLKDNAFIGASWHALGVGFERLQSLQVADTNLVTWKASDTYFSTLRWLVLRNCPEIEGIPDNLTKVLEKLELENVNSSVAASAKRIKAEKQLVELKQKSVWEIVPFELSIGPGCD